MGKHTASGGKEEPEIKEKNSYPTRKKKVISEKQCLLEL